MIENIFPKSEFIANSKTITIINLDQPLALSTKFRHLIVYELVARMITVLK